MNFFDMCEIETSLFDRRYAESNADWLLVKNIYENNVDKEPDGQHGIPKTIHFIWVGSPLPEPYAQNIEDWQNKNPDFIVNIWNDEKVESFKPLMKNADLFDAAPRFGGKSDILRYEILKKYGGLYVDIDFICNGDFSDLHEKHSFYAGICLERPVQLNNGLMASAPKHPILDICIDQMRLDNPWNIACPETLVLYQTGPWALTRSFLHHIKSNTNHEDLIIFPSQTFHPFPAAKRYEATEELVRSYFKPWTRACHLWHSSWQPNSRFYHGS